MGVDTFDHAEHSEGVVSKGKGQAFSLPRLLNDLYPGQGYSANEPYLLEVACGPMGWMVDLTYKDSLPRIRADDHGRWMTEYARSLVWRFGIEDAHEAIGTLLQMWEGFPTVSLIGCISPMSVGTCPTRKVRGCSKNWCASVVPGGRSVGWRGPCQ